MFFLGYYNMKAGGALGALAVGLIASNAWEKGVPRFASLGPALEYSPASEWGGLLLSVLAALLGSMLGEGAAAAAGRWWRPDAQELGQALLREEGAADTC